MRTPRGSKKKKKERERKQQQTDYDAKIRWLRSEKGSLISAQRAYSQGVYVPPTGKRRRGMKQETPGGESPLVLNRKEQTSASTRRPTTSSTSSRNRKGERRERKVRVAARREHLLSLSHAKRNRSYRQLVISEEKETYLHKTRSRSAACTFFLSD